MEKKIIILTPPIYIKKSDVLSQTIYNIFERGDEKVSINGNR